MKKFFTVLLLIVSFGVLFSCKKNDVADKKVDSEKATTEQTEKKEVKPPTAKEIGEAYGVVLAKSIQTSGIELDIEALKKAYVENIKKDVAKEKEQLAITTISSAMQISYQKKAEKTKKDGEEFLAKNAKKDGVKTLESGLQIETLTEGTGASPKTGDLCKIHYVGSFLDGKEFDSSHTHGDGEPVEIDSRMIIQGWQEGLTHMKTGGKYKLYIPYNLGYGENGVRHPSGEEIIPPFATLIFEIELIETKANDVKAAAPAED